MTLLSKLSRLKGKYHIKNPAKKHHMGMSMQPVRVLETQRNCYGLKISNLHITQKDTYSCSKKQPAE
ncbi:hypothetical protein QNI19_35665 [Cytophagaceae bacterium DM2B3-1]|uniref:Uncharacterized protein n=1 Tax=Xanthocytophaga flava TaxID=3048013 RepID=A0ABT7CX61_9BACT|nr:hypothetical protein [Xanthocytophaga flavus]MDJ1473346.1 hypothetical protein [Xanthocytophaga flavus]MDJ1498327.1 hypothetical protein [Xanthocytophaga flavus]